MKKIVSEAEFSAEQLNNINSLAAKTGLCAETVRILYGRGIDTADKIQGFLNPGKHRFLSPYLMSGMKEAVELIMRAREEEWSVAIYGDYDADGVCASTILYRALLEFGIHAAVYVPERKCGYGLNIHSIDEIFDEYFPQLFITVDCGISNAEEVNYLREQGADVIVTDHHELPEILPDCICINPKFDDEYPYDNLCGAGVAFKLANALIGVKAYALLDFAAIATVADSVPLTGENRDIVAEGLKLINSSPRKNYSDFLKKDEKITAQSLAFSVAPKINAAGRMGDANAALTLFMSDGISDMYEYSVKLTAYNSERQKCCDELYMSAKRMLHEKGAYGRVIVLCGEDWNAGFVGIVAARLAEEYCRPALLFVRNGDWLKGSARSIDGVNIFEALKACSHLIEEFGGHSQAAGVNVAANKLDFLESALNDYLHANYSAEAFTPTYYVNGKYSAPMSEKFVRELNMLEPYGVGNRKPLFIMETQSCRAKAIKEGSQHLSFKCGGLDLMYFSGAKFTKILKSAVPKEMVFEYAISYYRGKEQLQGYVRDVIYKPENCSAAEEDIALNGVLVASGEIIDCRASNISRSEAQDMLSGCGEYGTVFIVNSLSTLKKYDCCGLEVNIFTLSAGNLSNVILIAPIPECDLSGYENVVFLDSPAAITLPSLAGKRVLVCEEVDGTRGLTRLDTDRNALIEVFKRVSANAYNLVGDSLEDISRLNDLGATAEQALFALKVFEELGIITYKFGRLSVNRGVKSQLTNSRLYNYVSSVRD